MTDNPLLSVVIPMHNEQEMLPLLMPRLKEQLAPLGSYEIICVDDGSSDGLLRLLQQYAADDPTIRYLSFTRNFGKEAALAAGLRYARGKAIISMDADLQHPPELIAEMVRRWREDRAQVVQMVRRVTKESAFKRFTSWLFYALLNRVSDFRLMPSTTDFRLLDRSVVDMLAALPERNLFLRGLIPWLGFTQVTLLFMPGERAAGTTQYSLLRMLALAVSGFTSMGTGLLRLGIFGGLIITALAAFYGVYALFVHLVLGIAVPGWTSLLAGMMLIGGGQFLLLGLIGEYIGKILIEVKQRPNYIIRDQARPSLQDSGEPHL